METVKFDRRYKALDFTPEQIDAHVPNLKQSYRDILMATGSYRTMATDLGLNIGTVKSRLNRARAALAKEIRKEKII